MCTNDAINDAYATMPAAHVAALISSPRHPCTAALMRRLLVARSRSC